jgi:recombination protein RecA
MAADDRHKDELEATLNQIERNFGKGAIMRLGDRAHANVKVIPSGALTLDVALGVGGFPRGRIVEVFGPESSGKTTLAYHLVAEAQKAGGTCAFIDAEHAVDPGYARRVGVDIDSLLISQPDHGEQALEICELLVRSGGLDVVVIDSVAALVPRAELEGEMGDQHIGAQARMMSQALRKLAGVVNRTSTVVLFTNQLRESIGKMFGPSEYTPGGRALRFYSSVRIDIRRRDTLKIGTDAVGHRAVAKVVKNKVAPPFRQAEFDILFGEGISQEGCILDLGLSLGLVNKQGTHLAYGNVVIGQDRRTVASFLREHPDVAEDLEASIRRESGLPVRYSGGETPAPRQ